MNTRPRPTSAFHVDKFEEPTHQLRRVGHQVPGVVAVLYESMGGCSKSTSIEQLPELQPAQTNK